MTCEHCLPEGDEELKKNQKLWLDFSNLSVPGFEAHVAHTDADRDLALHRVNGVPQLEVVSFHVDESIRSGTDVILVAFSDMDSAVLEEPGTMAGKIVGASDANMSKCQLIQANYTSKKGTSGAPVILPTLMVVVGVQSESESAAKYAVSIHSIKVALQDWSGYYNENAKICDLLDIIAVDGKQVD